MHFQLIYSPYLCTINKIVIHSKEADAFTCIICLLIHSLVRGQLTKPAAFYFVLYIIRVLDKGKVKNEDYIS